MDLPIAANSHSTLASLPVGQTRRVARLEGAAEPDLLHRLMELGVLPGVSINVLHRVRGALVLQVRGTRLMLQAALAEHIHLEESAASLSSLL